ncbi:small acid-soluble spore protein Tlp [Alicyclobacillus mengziensis]|uniref:Small acid-soluble spore protein Tlp n=1 Tax=Alicyclobacillus mengziensis TaxID=2931921 RepID=A0A9X7W1M3_9BACL|nr:small acid-soluble spore protein Tlp [Alicyclobacillus mengziensis]QSO48984.1 small acid-soluble spore protein Tlp [Alicyclobacillus mengziensis]
MAKPDDRSDNVQRIARAIDNTMENLREAEDFVKAHADEMNSSDKADIVAKNERRRDAISGMREEIKDEASASHQKD